MEEECRDELWHVTVAGSLVTHLYDTNYMLVHRFFIHFPLRAFSSPLTACDHS